MSNRTIINMENISKMYDNGFVAVKNVNFSIREGEIHAVIGENGAGKSTLMKILCGTEKNDNGNIFINGKPIRISSPFIAINNSIGMIYQHFTLIPELTVYENIVLGFEPKKFKIFFDKKRAINIVKEYEERFNFQINIMEKVKNIPIAMKQKTEILKMLVRGTKILIFDEPTAVLTPNETEGLFRELINLKKKGYTIIFISHKLHEVKEISDTVTIMKKGRIVGSFLTKDISEKKLSKLMLSNTDEPIIDKNNKKISNNVLKINNLNYIHKNRKQLLKDFSITVKQNEILGIAAVEGNGQKELVNILIKKYKKTSGDVFINEKNAFTKNSNLQKEIIYIPDDRMNIGVALEGTIKENLIINSINDKRFSKYSILNEHEITKESRRLIEEYSINCENENQQVRMLSGGNIQKIVIARELSKKGSLIIAEQPTRGVDIGTSKIIHNKLLEFANNGGAVLLVSADIDELFAISDSIAVLYNGEIIGFFTDITKTSKSKIAELMAGIKTD